MLRILTISSLDSCWYFYNWWKPNSLMHWFIETKRFVKPLLRPWKWQAKVNGIVSWCMGSRGQKGKMKCLLLFQLKKKKMWIFQNHWADHRKLVLFASCLKRMKLVIDGQCPKIIINWWHHILQQGLTWASCGSNCCWLISF